MWVSETSLPEDPAQNQYVWLPVSYTETALWMSSKWTLFLRPLEALGVQARRSHQWHREAASCERRTEAAGYQWGSDASRGWQGRVYPKGLAQCEELVVPVDACPQSHRQSSLLLLDSKSRRAGLPSSRWRTWSAPRGTKSAGTSDLWHLPK